VVAVVLEDIGVVLLEKQVVAVLPLKHLWLLPLDHTQ